jgi:hypothetical protein
MPYSGYDEIGPNMPAPQQPGMFSRALSGAGNWIKDNPELFAMTADQIGQRLNPENPFGGIGTALAKSSLAGKAEDQRMKKQDTITAFLKQLTAPGTPGATSITISKGPNGETVYNAKGDLGSLGDSVKPPGLAPLNAQAPQTPPGTPPPAQNTQAGQAGDSVEMRTSYMEWLQQRALAGGQ